MSRRVARFGAVAALVAGGLAACSDGSIGVLGTGSVRRLWVVLDGPLEGLGAWRYYDGVRLLECDVQVQAWAGGGSDDATAEWLEGRVDLYDLTTGQYLASDYMYAGEMDDVWGSREIENGERQLSRPLRYRSYGPFSAYFVFRYDAGGVDDRLEHRFDCR